MQILIISHLFNKIFSQVYPSIWQLFNIILLIFFIFHCCCCCCSVVKSCLTVCNPEDCTHQTSLSFTSSKVCSNSCPLSQWSHPTVSSSVSPFSSLNFQGSRHPYPHCLAGWAHTTFLLSRNCTQVGLQTLYLRAAHCLMVILCSGSILFASLWLGLWTDYPSSEM